MEDGLCLYDNREPHRALGQNNYFKSSIYNSPSIWRLRYFKSILDGTQKSEQNEIGCLGPICYPETELANQCSAVFSAVLGNRCDKKKALSVFPCKIFIFQSTRDLIIVILAVYSFSPALQSKGFYCILPIYMSDLRSSPPWLRWTRNLKLKRVIWEDAWNLNYKEVTYPVSLRH